MTKKKPTQKLLKKKIIDILPDLEKQKAHARSLLGPNASEADVLAMANERFIDALNVLSKIEKPLGTSDRPFPMQGTQRVEGNSEIVLSVIADDSYPMKVYSDRPYNEVVALAYCDMPVPSMLSIFFDGLERRKPESTNRTQMMIGDPGHGKSFLGALQGRLRSTEPVEVYDCGGKNMNDLLFEMVLDFGAGDALPKAIDKRLAAGTLEPISQALLKQLSHATTNEAGDVTSIDWNALKTAGSDAVSTAFDTLQKVSKIEGLDGAGGNALGMNSQFGALIRAFQEGREIVLDEYNKSREGSDNALQTVWQFMIGEIKECTVENPLKNKDATSGPSYFTFKREDTGLGFFVTLTGNRTEDGTTTRSLNKSVYSRLSPDTLPYPEIIDWQHRICQMMVGMPVSTLYAAFQEVADSNPNAFGEWLLNMRQEKAKLEGTPIPELQLTLLENWKDVVDSSLKLAKFYNDWATLTDSEKIMTTGNADLVEEVDDEYTKKEGIDFRKIKQHLEQAIPLRPAMLQEDAPRLLDMKAWTHAPKLSEKIEENQSLNFGSRLTQLLEDVVYMKSGAVGKDRLHQKLLKSMETHGLRSLTLKEGQLSQQKSVEQALNISAYNSKDIKKQAVMAQKVLCDYLRSVDSAITAGNDDIIPVHKVQHALTHLSKTGADLTKLFVPNREHETLVAKPFVETVIKDSVEFDQGRQKGEINVDWNEFLTSDTNGLVDHADLMASFALPTVGRLNIDAVWDKNIRSHSEQDGDVGDDYDEGLNIAENKSKTGIALSSVMVNFNNAVVPVHIIKGAHDKVLVVSENVPTKLLAAFREAGIIHVDRKSANAEAKIEAALAQLTLEQQNTPNLRDRIMDAFSYRNDTDAEHLTGKNVTLSKALADERIPMYYPRYLMKAKVA